MIGETKRQLGSGGISSCSLLSPLMTPALPMQKSATASAALARRPASKYLEDRNLDAKQSEQFAHWFTGFPRLTTALKPDTYDIAAQYKSNGLLRYLDLYCGKNPKQRIHRCGVGFRERGLMTSGRRRDRRSRSGPRGNDMIVH